MSEEHKVRAEAWRYVLLCSFSCGMQEVAPFARELAILAARGRCEHSHDHAGGEAVCGGGHAQCDSEGNAADGDTPSDAGAGAATAAAADAAADAEAGSDDEGISLQEALEQAAHAAIEAMVEKRAAALRRQAELLDDLTREAIASEDALALLARFQRAQETRVHTYRALEECVRAAGPATRLPLRRGSSRVARAQGVSGAHGHGGHGHVPGHMLQAHAAVLHHQRRDPDCRGASGTQLTTAAHGAHGCGAQAALRDRIGSDSVADLARRVQTLERQKLALVRRCARVATCACTDPARACRSPVCNC